MTPEGRVPLAAIATAGRRPPARAVTPRLDHAAWRVRVAAWQSVFAATPGPDVALHLDDAGEFAAALFGAWQAGRTPWLPGDVLPATLARLAGQVAAFAGDLPDGRRPADPAAAASDVATALDAATAAAADTDLPELDADACRLVLYTSGSTGDPTPVAKTLRQLDAEVVALEAAFGDGLGDACVHGTVSHQHVYGLLFRVLWPLSAGRPFAPRRLAFAEDIAALPASPLVLVASPAHLKRLPDTLDWSTLAGALRAVFSSGGPLPADAAGEVRRLWRRPATEVFGSTETGGIAWRRDAGRWRPLPGVRWRLAQDRLHVRSPHLHDDAWHATQDRACADGDDGFVLLGRADRIVKIEERRVSLDAIERALLDGRGLREVRAIALAGPRTLVAIVAVPDADGAARLERLGRAGFAAALRAGITDAVEPIALPRRWRFVDALPSDARGKATERALAALFRPTLPTPQWLERDAETATARLLVEPDLAAFDGHFPRVPILPGVVLLEWAVRLARDAFGPVGEFAGLEALKFQHTVPPGTELQIDLERRPGRLAFRFTSAAGTHAAGRLLFDEAGR